MFVMRKVGEAFGAVVGLWWKRSTGVCETPTSSHTLNLTPGILLSTSSIPQLAATQLYTLAESESASFVQHPILYLYKYSEPNTYTSLTRIPRLPPSLLPPVAAISLSTISMPLRLGYLLLKSACQSSKSACLVASGSCRVPCSMPTLLPAPTPATPSLSRAINAARLGPRLAPEGWPYTGLVIPEDGGRTCDTADPPVLSAAGLAGVLGLGAAPVLCAGADTECSNGYVPAGIGND